LAVGRGLGCEILIEDPSVSRLQCEIQLKDGAPMLRHRSGSQDTLVNGEACTTAMLRLGDVIQFASYRLIVDIAPEPRDSTGQVSENTPTTQSFTDSPYLSTTPRSVPVQAPPEFTSDVVSLYTLLRTLAKLASLAPLVDELKAHLTLRFGPCRFWLALGSPDSAEIVPYPPVPRSDLDRIPVANMRQAVASGEGIRAIGEDGREVLCAPLVHATGPFGAVAISRNAIQGAPAELDLHYVLAVAEGVSPLILAAERMEQLQRDQARAWPKPPEANLMLGTSEEVVNLRRRLAEAASARGNVLVLGETGVGKELAARMVHDLSRRAGGPYVVVNCAAIPDELFESEVFGHNKGAFTGASGARAGLFEQAHGGTLFLDEVGELSPMNQARLLRVVETGTLRRLGSNEDLSVDVRIVSATNRPLPDSSEKHLRIDLFYRLSSFSIWIPPLRERASDIPEIAAHFLARFSAHSPARPVAIAEEAITKLKKYQWPGNIRELANTIERACYTASDQTILERDILLPQDAESAPIRGGQQSLDDVERGHLLKVLSENENNVAMTAQALGMAASTLYYKLRRHKISLRNPK